MAGLAAERAVVPRNAPVHGVGFGAVPVEKGGAAAPGDADAAAPRTSLSANERLDDDADERVARERVTCDLPHHTLLTLPMRGVPIPTSGAQRVASHPRQDHAP